MFFCKRIYTQYVYVTSFPIWIPSRKFSNFCQSNLCLLFWHKNICCSVKVLKTWENTVLKELLRKVKSWKGTSLPPECVLQKKLTRPWKLHLKSLASGCLFREGPKGLVSTGCFSINRCYCTRCTWCSDRTLTLYQLTFSAGIRGRVLFVGSESFFHQRWFLKNIWVGIPTYAGMKTGF